MTGPVSIAPNQVVQIHYTLREDDGDVLDSSIDDEPLEYLHGHDGIVPGLEAALLGKVVGDKFKVDVPPDQGYGYPNPTAKRRIPRSAFPADLEFHEGMQFIGPGTNGEPAPIWVVEAHDSFVEVTTDHPLAGYTLHFEVEVVSIREATAEEIEHGHTHGAHGHDHDHDDHDHDGHEH